MNIKRFEDFSNINENSEFDFQHLNATPGAAAGQFNNPTLSRDSYDKHQGLLTRSVTMLTTLGQNAAPSIAGLKGKLALTEQNITDLKILRIVQRNTIIYDAYITFIIQNVEYWGLVEDITTKNASLTSEVFKDGTLIQSKEWIIRTKGFIVNTIQQWLLPKEGEYKLLENSIDVLNNISGELQKITQGTIVKLIRASENKITINIGEKRYTLINKNFIYFNWWFELLSD
jgi:hypothetical protein